MPITTSFADVWTTVDRIRQITADKSYADLPPEPAADASRG